MKKESPPKHPLDAIPFEVFYHGSYHGVSLISIKSGSISVQINYHGSVVEDIVCSDFLRVRSRKARASDCSHILKDGADVCVLSTHPIIDFDEQERHESGLSWVDAKIMSIKRDHHEGRCACQFSVILNRAKLNIIANCTSDRVTTEVVTIDRVAILQKLQCESREDGIHHWTCSEDLTNIKRSRLLTGTVSSELSWLVVYSVLKGVDFNIKLVQNRIVYAILNYDKWSYRLPALPFDNDNEGDSPNSEESIKVLSFQTSNETLKPIIETLFCAVPEEIPAVDTIEEEDCGCQPVNSESDVEILYDYVSLRRSKRQKVLPERFTSYCEPNFNRNASKKDDGLDQSTAMVASLLMDEEPLQMQQSSSSEMNINQLIEWLPVLEQATCSNKAVTHDISGKISGNISDGKSIIPFSAAPLTVEVEDISDTESSQNSFSEESEDTSDSESELQSKPKSKHETPQIRSKRGRPSSHKGYCKFPHPFKNGRPTSRGKQRKHKSRHSRKRKPLSESECKQLIDKIMGSTEPEMGSYCQPEVEQPENIAKFLEDFVDLKWSPLADTEIGTDENEDLWKQMEDSLTTLTLLQHKQMLDAEFFIGTTNTVDNNAEQPCQHIYKLDDQIGIVCQLCNFVSIEIRYVTPPMLQNVGWFSAQARWDMDDLRRMGLYNMDSVPVGNAFFTSNCFEAYDCVWSPISNLKSKLHSHQKRAFEFMWRNIAGSSNPENMNSELENTGGCVISHTPGSGKTLSVISFLVSYLRLYPRSRPLVLAPKTAVYIWWKEFAKWGVSTPVHLIQPFESYKKEVWEPNIKHSSAPRPNVKMMYIIDYLTKLKHWREKPGVLLMSYSAFFNFTFKESKFEYKRFMAEMLLTSPGILILDEGHNPRSTISKLRKQLMKVGTDLRILLSGTLFQNNFEEYFNTLTLARPRFVDDVIKQLDPGMNHALSRKKSGRKINRKERLARKLFVEEIGRKIESENESVRRQGFDLLHKTTNLFVDSHDGDAAHELPGLQIYTVVLMSSDVQSQILSKLQAHITQKRCPLDLELLITVASIHPWLIKTVASVDDYFNSEELEKIEKYKKNFRNGSKVKFLVDLVHKSSIRNERVLIFCHNIPPINFLSQLFEDTFGWSRGKEILVLQGDQELFERARIMEKFNAEQKNTSKVLLASTLACAEGISLTAASRVVLLDSEWNHAKTRQAIARAFRPGQKKMVYVYRLLALDTWEEEKYNSNEWKAWLSKMIFVNQYINFTCSKKVEVPEDDELLKELAEEDKKETFQMILKQD